MSPNKRKKSHIDESSDCEQAPCKQVKMNDEHAACAIEEPGFGELSCEETISHHLTKRPLIDFETDEQETLESASDDLQCEEPIPTIDYSFNVAPIQSEEEFEYICHPDELKPIVALAITETSTIEWMMQREYHYSPGSYIHHSRVSPITRATIVDWIQYVII